MNLHGFTVTAGDYIHDVVDGRLRVVDVEASSFTVRMPNGQFRKYDHSGRTSSRRTATAYWHNPIIVNPYKDARSWDEQRRYIDSAATILRAQANLIGEPE